MKNIKKITSLLLSVMIIIGALGISGCTTNKSDNTLLWYMFGDKPANHDRVMEKVNEIVEREIGMKLDLQYIDSASYAEKMKLKMAAQEEYDIAFSGYINGYQEGVALGGFYDITEIIDEVGIREVIPDFYLEAATVDGKIYGIPNIQVVSNPACLHMDKTLAEELNIDMNEIQIAAQNVHSFEDVKKYINKVDSVFEKVHTARPDSYVFNPSYSIATLPMYEIVVNGIWIRNDGSSDKLVKMTDTDEWKYRVEKLHEWFKKGYIRNDIASKGNALTSDEEKKQIVVRSNTWKPGQELNDAKVYGEEQVYALLTKPYVGRTSALATTNVVGANSKHPKEAVQFLKLINSDKELFNLICWGIEGENYTKNEEGKIKEVPNSGYNDIGKSAWKYGNQFNSLILETQENDVWEQTEEMNDNAIKSPMLGFVVNTDSIATEMANLTNVMAEYTARADFGTEAPDVWMDEFLNKMEQAGYQKILDELQRQYDEFLKSKN